MRFSACSISYSKNSDGGISESKVYTKNNMGIATYSIGVGSVIFAGHHLSRILRNGSMKNRNIDDNNHVKEM